jgi:hypothetical protein
VRSGSGPDGLDGAANDRLGVHLASDGDVLVVGASFDDGAAGAIRAPSASPSARRAVGRRLVRRRNCASDPSPASTRPPRGVDATSRQAPALIGGRAPARLCSCGPRAVSGTLTETAKLFATDARWAMNSVWTWRFTAA